MRKQTLRAAVAAAAIALGGVGIAFAQPASAPAGGYGPGYPGMGPGMMNGNGPGGGWGPGNGPGRFGPHGARGPAQGPGYGGWGMGPGMMGPGWGGGYGGGMGPWMMGGGYGGGVGPGMMGGYGGMGPWMMGGYGGGYGGMGPGMMGPGWGGYGPYGALDLTDAQQKKMDAIAQAQFKQQWALMEQMQVLMHDSWRTMHGPDIDVDAAMKTARSLSDLRLKMLRNRLEARKQMQAVLTKEQRDELMQMQRRWGW